MDPIAWVLIAISALVFIVVVSSIIFSFAGVWERVDDSVQLSGRERIRLVQFIVFVLGKRVVAGGQQSFFGFAFGNTLWLRRRDRGILHLKHEGFPDEVAKQVEGQVMAQYRLHLSKDHNFLNGVFIPYRVEFSARPPRVTAMHPQPPVPRRYRRVELIVEPKLAAAASPAVK